MSSFWMLHKKALAHVTSRLEVIRIFWNIFGWVGCKGLLCVGKVTKTMTSANMAKESGATMCVEGESINSNKNSKLV